MADSPLAVLSTLLSPTDLELFQSSLMALIDSTVKQRVKTVKKLLSDKVTKTLDSQRGEIEAVNSSLDSAISAIKALQEDFITLESDRHFQSGQLLRRQSTMSDAEDRVERFSQEVEKIQSSLIEITSELATKANLSDVNRVSAMMGTLCTAASVQRLEEKVGLKAEAGEVRELGKWVESVARRIDAECCSRGEVDTRLKALTEHFDRGVKGCVALQHFARINQEFTKSMNTLQTQLQDSSVNLKADIFELSTALRVLKDELSTKASVYTVSDIRVKLETLATVKSVERTNETVEKCYMRTEEVKAAVDREIARYEEALRRFDEIVLDKANKADCLALENRTAKAKDVEDMKRQLDSLEQCHASSESLLSKHSSLHSDVSKQLQEAKSALFQLKSDKQSSVYLQTAVKLILEKLDSKAEKSDLATLSDLKSSKLEVQSLVRSLGVMHRVAKLVIMLLHHCIKCVSETTAEVSPTTFASTEWLLKHAEMVSAWASLYEPIENEIEFPPDIQSLLTAAKSSKGLARGSISPIGQTPRGKTSGLSSSHAFGVGQITKKLLMRRYESVTRRNATHLPSLESASEYQ